MDRFICEGILDFLSEEQKRKLNKKFRVSEQKVMPHEIAGPLGLEYSEALAVLAALQAEGYCRNLLLTYHNCEPDIIIKATPFEEGIPNFPFVCEICQELIQDINELSFDTMAVIRNAIEFI